jgi:glutamate carboxypeptidase
MSYMNVSSWISQHAEDTVSRAPSQLQALTQHSSRVFEHEGLGYALIALQKLIPEQAAIEQLPSSSPDGLDDLVFTLTGSGKGRLLLVGNADTLAPAEFVHHPFHQQGNDIYGSGVHQKSGLVIAAAVMRALVQMPTLYERVQLLVVCDHYNRTVSLRHYDSDIGKADVCLGFSGGEEYDGQEGVIVRRQGAWTMSINAYGRGEFSPLAVKQGGSALEALSTLVKRLTTDIKQEDEAVTVVPTRLQAGTVIDRTPESGQLECDVHAYSEQTARNMLAMVPEDLAGVRLDTQLHKRFPGLDSRQSSLPLLRDSVALLDRPLHGFTDSRPSDVSWFAQNIPLSLDGLGALGGVANFTNEDGSKEPVEHVQGNSFYHRTAIAFSIVYSALYQAQRRDYA